MTIPKLIEVIEQRIEAYKATLEWVKKLGRPVADKDFVESMIGAYQDVLNIINEE